MAQVGAMVICGDLPAIVTQDEDGRKCLLIFTAHGVQVSDRGLTEEEIDKLYPPPAWGKQRR
jgi:hypothetical protein